MRITFAMALVVAAASIGCEDFFDNVPVSSPTVVPAVPGTDSDPRALTAYDDILAGYGTWQDDDTYGTVWTPSDPSFVPFATHGRFANVGGTMVWLSALPWGAATLHHGRWVNHDDRWHWVPGIRYASAWVTFTHEGGTTSWAPTPPTLVWHNGYAVRIDPPESPIVGTSDDASLSATPSISQANDVEESEFARRWLEPHSAW